MAMFETVAEIITDAAKLLGLPAQQAAAPFSATDPNIVQLLALLKSAGRDLLREHPWSQLQTPEYTLTTSPGVDRYAMPLDFDRHVDQTQWNHSTTLPLAGPFSPQGWQRAKALAATPGTSFFFRTEGTQLVIYPLPSSLQTLMLEYMSRYWVQSNGALARDKDKPTADDDTVWLDSQMMVHRIRMDFLRSKGFDSTAATDDYEDALSNAKSATAAAPVYSLNSSAALPSGLPPVNLPPTGWGT
jgi:hypothetical protein